MLRYPGGKEKLKSYIIKPINCFYNNKSKPFEYEYREPFFGGGAVGINIVKGNTFPNIWINDKDYSLCCFWSSIINKPEKMIEEIQKYKPTPESFHEIKSFLVKGNFENQDPVSIGVKKLIVHRTSFSGLGTMSGPLGGVDQKGKYKNDARWSVSYLVQNVISLNSYFKTRSVREGLCTNLDCMDVLQKEGKWFAYLDPPYYEMGDILYPVKFSPKQHQDLADFLKRTDQYWILSYDNSQEIRRMYSWAHIKEIEANYSITGAKKKTELVIYPNKVNFAFDLSEQLKTKNIF